MFNVRSCVPLALPMQIEIGSIVQSHWQSQRHTRDILIPEDSWQDKIKFEETAYKLGRLFQENFESFANGVSREVLSAGPQI